MLIAAADRVNSSSKNLPLHAVYVYFKSLLINDIF